MESQDRILLYNPDVDVKLDVRLEDDTVWLNRSQLAELFARDIKTIGKHINNALREELSDMATVAKFATVQTEGNRMITRQVEYYNLDMILSVGYRVKSNRGVEFRHWANRVLKEHLLKGYSFNNRLSTLEHTVAEHTKKIDFFIKASLPPVEGVFYDGQIFDAYNFAVTLIQSARESIILIDNYIDTSVLTILSKREQNVSASIYTKSINSQLQLDIEKYCQQYPPIKVYINKKCHDRFLIIDKSGIYHIGASLKDLGKKMFAFSKLEIPATTILNMLQQ